MFTLYTFEVKRRFLRSCKGVQRGPVHPTPASPRFACSFTRAWWVGVVSFVHKVLSDTITAGTQDMKAHRPPSVAQQQS